MKEEIIKSINKLSKNKDYQDIKQYLSANNSFYDIFNCQLFAYLRVSTGKQEFGRQVIELYKWLKKKNISICVDNIYCDKFTGKTLSRKEYNKVRSLLSKNDYFIISDLNRLGRGKDGEGYEKIKEEWHYLKYKGVKILISADEMNEFLSAPLPNESVQLTLSKLYMQDMIFINSLYKDCLKLIEVSRSTIDGLEKAKADGKKIGHPRSKKANKNNFINTLELITTHNIGQAKATLKSGFPKDTFTRDIKKCYEKYDTKDYLTILKNVKMETQWPL